MQLLTLFLLRYSKMVWRKGWVAHVGTVALKYTTKLRADCSLSAELAHLHF